MKMSDFLQGLLPAGAGVAVALMIFPGRSGVPAGGEVPKPVAAARGTEAEDDETKLAPLPQDVVLARAMAECGGVSVTDLRRRVMEGVAAEMPEEELAQWVGLLIQADPGELEALIGKLPAAQAQRLVMMGLWRVGADEVWEALAHSPTALAWVREQNLNRGSPWAIFRKNLGSEKAGDVLFDPALGLTATEISRCCYEGEPAGRILEEWRAGRWKPELAQLAQRAWVAQAKKNPQALEELVKSLPPERREEAAKYEAYARLTDRPEGGQEEARVEDLKLMDGPNLTDVSSERVLWGRPLDLKTVVALPEVSASLVSSYMVLLYDRHPEEVPQIMEHLDEIEMTPALRTQVVAAAAERQYERENDLETALRWVDLIQEEKERPLRMMQVLGLAAQWDPERALRYVDRLPAGEIRDRVIAIANASKR